MWRKGILIYRWWEYNWYSQFGKQYGVSPPKLKISYDPAVPHLGIYPMLCLVGQSCLTLCDSMDCSPPGSSVHGDSPGNNTGVGCHALLQEIFPTQRSNPGLPQCRWILYHLSHQGSPVLHPKEIKSLS